MAKATAKKTKIKVTKKRVYPTEWKVYTEKLSDRIEIQPSNHGEMIVRTFKDIVYRRRIGFYEYETRLETEPGPNLSEMLQVLRISEKQDSLFSLMTSGFKLLEGLVRRYSLWLWNQKLKRKKIEERRRAKRRKAIAKKKAEKAAKRLAKQLAKEKEKLALESRSSFIRKLDV